jgi:hypothetical protein
MVIWEAGSIFGNGVEEKAGRWLDGAISGQAA